MKKLTIDKNLVTKGLFALGAVAIVGVTTATYAATNATDNTTSGYGTTSTADTAASNDFDTTYATLTANFVDSLNVSFDQNAATLGANGQQFADSFNADTATYNSSVSAASAAFRASVVNAINSGESKDKFIDTFNHAKADYFNAVDVAKNTLAAQMSGLGDKANQAKDSFIGAYNSARDAYGNQLEAAKNTFADRVSNA